MKKHLYKTFVFCFVLFSFKVFAQSTSSYNVKQYTILDGLSNNWISDIYQDKDDFLWFGTQYGLNKFDGQNFKVFTYIPGDSTSLRANWVRSIIQLNDEKIYIGTLGGSVNILNPYKEKFNTLLSYSDSTTNSILIINKLVKSKDNQLWISSSNGAYHYNPNDEKLTRPFNKRSSNITIGQDSSVYISAKEDVYNVFGDSVEALPVFKNKEIQNLFSISKDSLLIYTVKDLFIAKRDENTWHSDKLNFETSYSSSVRDSPFIFQDQEDWIWVNGGDKLYKFSKDLTQQYIYVLNELLNVQVEERIMANCMFQDAEGSYWLGTNIGAFQLIAKKPLTHPVLGPLGKVREIIDCGNKTWFALPGEIKVWNQRDSVPNLVSKHSVTSLVCASDGFVYTLINEPDAKPILLKINSIDNTIETIQIPKTEISSSPAWKIVEDQNHRLWIAQWDGVLIYDLKDQTFIPIRLFEGNFGIIEMFADDQDNIWIGTLSKGLLKFSNASRVDENSTQEPQQFLHDNNNPNSLSSNLIQAIHQTKDGKLWVGTDGGLNSIDLEENKFQRYTRKDQLVNDKILNITSDDDGILWMSSISHGIISYNSKTKKFTNYTTNDGLYDNSMLLSSVYRNKEGFIWMGSERGVQYFHPGQLVINTAEQPNLLWTSYTKYRKDTLIEQSFPDRRNNVNSTLYINPEDQNVTLRFTTTTFIKPQNIRYRFWLKGFHQTWLPTQEKGVLTLSEIPRGNYTLQVESIDVDNRWNVSYDLIPIVVIPPWYRSNMAYVIYTIVAFLLFFSFYRIQLRRKVIKKEKEFIEELATSKSRWFNQIAHEFRTPLTVIVGAIEQLKDKLDIHFRQKVEAHVNQIEDQTSHLSNQIHQILEIAQIQDHKLQIQETPGDFVAFVRYVYNSLDVLAKENETSLNFSSTCESLNIYFDEDKWRKIIVNLLSNAIKYNNRGEPVSIILKYEENKSIIHFIVQDKGMGMSPDFLAHIFTPFHKGSDNSKGVGLGLALTKELVILLGGYITVKSEEKIGTTFTLQVPVKPLVQTSNNFENNLIVNDDSSVPLILIAEDQKEVRNYIEFCLRTSYRVMIADNGLEAWELCEKHLPDLVISDIMMPEWDGLKLGSEIKKNVATNHIPIIFLTAKAGQQEQLEGLKTGADAYLTKPFAREELLIRVNNLILSRKELQEKYKTGTLNVSVENKAIDSFMKSIIRVVKNHVDDDAFGVTELADELNMSRVHLYRKIKNLTDMSPTHLIRKIKIQIAKDLLLNTEDSIAQIAYQTGFKDPSYFTKVYIEEFGVTPSQSRKQNPR